MLQALINLFKFTKQEEAQAECPYKVEAPVVEPQPEATPVVEAKPAKIKAAKKKPAVKAKTARSKKKNG